MILDLHVHISALTHGHGFMSPRLQASIPFTFMHSRLGIKGDDATMERKVEELLVRTVNATTEIDGIVLLAFDAVSDRDGNLDWPNTHLYVTNDYAIDVVKRNKRMFFAASIHPYRKDAVAELQRCVAAGAVMVKWLPIVQNFNPADARCIPFYEALAHLKIPLLSHTGSEHALPNLDRAVADPMLLTEALKRGVKVIAAHCGSRLMPWEIDFVPNWAKMAKEHEHFYGDTAALNMVNRWYAYDTILNDPVLLKKLVHGSDWPIPAFPPPFRVGWKEAWTLAKQDNWMKRDVLIKQKLGFDDDYWHRGAALLGIGS